MGSASRTVTIRVETEHGTNADARHVLDDLLDEVRNEDWTFDSAGNVDVTITRPRRKK